MREPQRTRMQHDPVNGLALGSMLTFLAIIAGAVAMLKFQYWRIMREA